MFIEKLKDEDINEFVSKYLKGFDVANIVKVNNFYQFELLEQNSNSTLKFTVTDFDCKGMNIMAKCGEDIVKEKWNKFMSLKFGKEYKTEKLNYIKNINNNIIK